LRTGSAVVAGKGHSAARRVFIDFATKAGVAVDAEAEALVWRGPRLAHAKAQMPRGFSDRRTLNPVIKAFRIDVSKRVETSVRVEVDSAEQPDRICLEISPCAGVVVSVEVEMRC
jgi:hypothetical protein